jgi:hypothetical protein
MDYIDVEWRHELPLEPVRLVSELDRFRMEVRKLEFFRDGSVGRAWGEGSSLGTDLSTEPVPSIDQINGDGQFRAKAIDDTEFERLWSASVTDLRGINE